MPALSLAVFGSLFYWVDDKGLWQAPREQPNQKQLLWKTKLPLLAVYSELQQPRGAFELKICSLYTCRLLLVLKSDHLFFILSLSSVRL